MRTRFIEATNGPQNWGKFAVGRFDVDETMRRSHIDPDGAPLLRQIGWHSNDVVWVFDLQTREGAAFDPGGYAKADLAKHRVWVCPLFEPFLAWLYEQDLSDLDALPGHVDLPNAPFAFYGYRRDGKTPGDVLREELARRSITQAVFAQRIGRPVTVLSEIMNARKTVTPDTALQFEEALGIPAEIWLNLQTQHQLSVARKRRALL